ncbi:MAG: nucleotide exchange factor GrpE, partial [Clostridia bacterium]|nr:nucleotide exchange factor GrpE [Clostridia bacterium]
IDTDESEEYESGDIVKVASKGFIYKDKVIRYSQVIVKK